MLRADVLLSRFGYCSRREAAAWIRAGRIRLDQEPVTSPSAKLDPARVLVDGEPIPFVNGIFVALHKPLGYTCSHTPENGAPTIYELLPTQWSARSPAVQSIGRLDKETSGLLLLSDDGNLVHALTSPRRYIQKVYEYRTVSPVPPKAPALFASGSLTLNGEKNPCLPAALEPDATDPCHGFLRLHEGRYHQVRRMLAAVGAPVAELTRVAIGSLQLASLSLLPGQWAPVNPQLFIDAP